MKHALSAIVVSAALAAFSSLVSAQPATQPADSAVPVKAVVLFSSGVGYFEHFGTVTGNTAATLQFKTNQINDILKSLVLEDLDKGKITSVIYPSQDPLSRTLKSFAVDIASNPSLAELLNQLRGAKVSVAVAAENLSGTILGLEQKPKAVGQTSIQVWVLNILTGGTIRSVELADVQKIQLEDAKLQEELNKALAALSQARDQDKKPVTIQFMGEGERRVRVGYVVETPIWKTSYRLLLPPKPQDKPALQGWAIVENQTDSDWNNVQLSLVSGRPISFIQDLYQPMYIPRPVVQPELYASLRPQTYEGGMDLADKEVAVFGEGGGRFGPAAPAPSAAPAGRGRRLLEDRAEAKGGVRDGFIAGEALDAARNRPADFGSSVASVASASKIGELFQYTVGNVTLPRQRSAMIPIITDPIEVEKLSIYNQSVLPKNPLNGARVKNTTGKHLLAGPVTVLDGSSYAGDARIDNLPPGQERLISYGIDLQVLVNATAGTNTSTIQSGKIVKGVLQVSRKNVFTQDYTLENKGEADKAIIVEHPFRQGWTLVDTVKPIETTEAVYRFKDKVAAGKSSKLTVKQENVSWQSIAILPCDIGQLEFYAKTGEIDGKVREALRKAIELKGAMTDTQRQIDQRKQEIATITQEQARIRENMKTVAQTSQYYNRLLAKLNEQETKIEKLQEEVGGLQGQLDQQRKALEDYLSNLSVG